VPPAVIEDPILNSPFAEPTRHFRFSDNGITNEIVEGRRESGYFLPIASPRKKSGQMKFDGRRTGSTRIRASTRSAAACGRAVMPGSRAPRLRTPDSGAYRLRLDSRRRTRRSSSV